MHVYNGIDLTEYLNKLSVMSIAVSHDTRPLSSVVLFMVDRDLCFYFLTKRVTHKAKALAKNPQASITAWKQNQLLVQAYGKVHEIPDIDENHENFEKFKRINDEMANTYWPISATKGSEYCMYKVMTEWLKVTDLSSDQPEHVHQIIDL